MVKLNINLDEALKSYVDAQVAAGRYRSADDLIADLLRIRVKEGDSAYSAQRDFGDDHPDVLRKLIQQGLESGPSQRWTKEDFEASKQRVLSKHPNRG